MEIDLQGIDELFADGMLSRQEWREKRAEYLRKHKMPSDVATPPIARADLAALGEALRKAREAMNVLYDEATNFSGHFDEPRRGPALALDAIAAIDASLAKVAAPSRPLPATKGIRSSQIAAAVRMVITASRATKKRHI